MQKSSRTCLAIKRKPAVDTKESKTVMKKASNYLVFLITSIFAGICGYITFHSFTYSDRLKHLNTSLIPGGEMAILMLAGICFVAALCLLFFWLENFLSCKICKEKKQILEILFVAGSMGSLLLGQLVLIRGIGQNTFMFDSGRLYDEAIHMLTTHTLDGNAMDGYLAMYPNNIPATILFYWLASVGAFFGLAEPQIMVLLQVENALCIDGAILLTFFLLRNYVSGKCAHMFLLVCLLNPTVYIWGGFVYTTTYCMPFLMGGLLLFLSLLKETPFGYVFMDKKQVKKQSNNKEKGQSWLMGKGILLGVLLAGGFRLRATLIITLLACVLYLILCLLFFSSTFRNDKRVFQIGLKKGKGCLTFILVFLLSLPVFRGVENFYVKFDTRDTAFPVISWLAMGLEGSGGFNGTDFYDTKNAPTAEKKSVSTKKNFGSA